MESYLGSITMFAFNWAPRDFAACAGQLVPVSQNTALFSLLGMTFGGDGRTTFALPDLRGRVPVGEGGGPGLNPRVIGELFGRDTMTLNTNHLAPHTHPIGEQQHNQTAVVHATDTIGNVVGPAGHYLAKAEVADGSTGVKAYSSNAADTTLASDAVTINAGNLIAGSTGGGLPFPVDQPSLVLGFAICTAGVYPSRP